MIKTFVTTVSLQGKTDLLRRVYEPIGFALAQNRPTSFPIIPIIANEIEKGEEIQIIALRLKNVDTQDNYEILMEELAELGITRDQIIEISLAENQSKENGRELLMRILEEIQEDSLVYADITFGTKPMSAILLYAMNFIEKVKDVEVQGIYYGEIRREKGIAVDEKANLYELTSLKFLGDLIEQLNYMDVANPLGALRELLNM